MSSEAGNPQTLRREIGVPQATMLGLGSMLGAGVFVAIAQVLALSGPLIPIVVLLAGFVAVCNGLSSAQLAAKHPVSGGTYEYGHRELNGFAGFAAGWMFLLAKSASAATAALGLAYYLLGLGSILGGVSPSADAAPSQHGGDGATVVLAAGLVLGVGAVVWTGLRISAKVNALLVLCTLIGLSTFCAIVFSEMSDRFGEAFGGFSFEAMRFALGGAEPVATEQPASVGGRGEPFQVPIALQPITATALMFVAYTGYGRVATLGEEIREPRRSIPLAVVTTLVVSAVVYLAVGVALWVAGDHDTFAVATAAPLEDVLVRKVPDPALQSVGVVAVTVGAITALSAVLINLLLGLSRVVLAMARRGELPRGASKIDAGGVTPRVALLLVVVGVVTLVLLLRDVRVAWSVSALFVLSYYALTNLAATRLIGEDRFVARWVPWAGFAGCVGLLSAMVATHPTLAAFAIVALVAAHRLIRARLASAEGPFGRGEGQGGRAGSA